MASIFTGLAFMHGHIVNRKLVIELGRAKRAVENGRAPETRPARPAEKPRECDHAVACC